MDTNVQDQLTKTLNGISIGQLAVSILILVAGIILTKLLDKLLRKLLVNSRIDSKIKELGLQSLKILLYLISITVAVSALGINTNAIVAIISVASLGITLALETIISNVASGIILITTKPFTVGQYIETDGKEGVVQSIHLNHTEILTPNGTTVIIPNKTLSSNVITNYYSNGKRRLLFNVSCAYGEPTEKVKKGFMSACEQFPEILKDPLPEIYVAGMEESDIKYNLYVWVKNGDALPVQKAFMTTLRDELEKNDVKFAYPHIVMQMQK